MAKRRVWTALGVAFFSTVGSVVMRRRRRGHQTRVDLYFDDGSMLSLQESAPEAAGAVPLARDILSLAGPSAGA